MSSLEGCYQCSRGCAGSCVGFLASYVPVCCCCCYYPYVKVLNSATQVNTNEVGLKKEFGKYREMCKPGLNYFNPCTEQIVMQSIQTNIIDMRNQKVFTKDNIGVTIDAVTFYRVVDPVKSSFVVNDLVGSIVQITFVTLRVVCGEYTLQDLLEARVRITEEIETFVRRSAEQWGTLIERVLIKDMKLSTLLQNNLSTVSKTKRLCESRIISAKADLDSAKLYREAADIMDTRAAMQIRFLQTLSDTRKKPGNKLLILPLDAQQPLDLS